MISKANLLVGDLLLLDLFADHLLQLVSVAHDGIPDIESQSG